MSGIRIKWDEPRVKALEELMRDGCSYNRAARELTETWGFDVTFNQVRQTCVRNKIATHATLASEIARKFEPYKSDWRLTGDWCLTGDWELPFIDVDLFQQMLKRAKELKIRNLLITGDVFEFERLGPFAAVVPQAHPTDESAIADAIMDECLGWFRDIRCASGNHDLRMIKALEGAVEPGDVIAALCHKLGGDERVRWSIYGHCTIETETGEWRVTHPGNYSRVPLSVPKRLASKFLQHIVSFHGHTTAMGFDESGKYIVASIGCLADIAKLAYHMLVDSTHPEMNNGYAYLKDGRLSVYSDHPGWGIAP